MSGEVVGSENSAFMREVIASVVGSDQEKYSEAILGRENKAYCNWIQGKDAWGGAIEVQILAEYFQVEIMVVDTKSGNNGWKTIFHLLNIHYPGSQTIFGETQNFPQRMVLIYDGIHYDPLFLRYFSSNCDFPKQIVLSCRDSGEVKTVHSSKDQRITGLALVVAEVHE